MRKTEMERRTERKVQKERELEGDEFQDKESFVTPAYRAKLAELKQAEEEENQKDRLESILDVTKQRDLSGFYRHLYTQTFAEKTEGAREEEPPVSFKTDSTDPEHKSRRQYRQRRSESPEAAAALEPLQPGNDKNSESESEVVEGKSNATDVKNGARPAASAALLAAAATDRAAAADRADNKVTVRSSSKAAAGKQKEPNGDSDSDDSGDRGRSTSPAENVGPSKENIEPEKVKIDIWKKRHTGDLLDAALERYLLRKEARQQGLVLWP